MAIDLNEKPWWVALIVGLVLGIALFVVLQMYVFKPIQEDCERAQDTINELEREIEEVADLFRGEIEQLEETASL